MKSVSIVDVAKQAGVSITTVSRIIKSMLSVVISLKKEDMMLVNH